MDKGKREKLEAAGFKFGDAEDFLGLNECERRMVDLRVRLARTIRRLREQEEVSQTVLARRISSSQSRVAKIEAASPDVSIDLSIRALYALGGGMDVIDEVREQLAGTQAQKSKSAKTRKASPRIKPGKSKVPSGA